MTCKKHRSVFEDRGTCDYCGAEVSMHVLDRDNRCPDCKEPELDNDEEVLNICVDCNGSGEGQREGSTCPYCRGRGVV